MRFRIANIFKRAGNTLLGGLVLCQVAVSGAEFEGTIATRLKAGDTVRTFRYTAGETALRLEVIGESRPTAVDLQDRATGGITLIYPHNRSFVKLPIENGTAQAPEMPPAAVAAMAGMGAETPPGPQGLAGAPARTPGMPEMPAGVGPRDGAGIAGGIPMPPMMMGAPMVLVHDKEKTNILGYTCYRYTMETRGEKWEIWATDQLMPFLNYMAIQQPKWGPIMLEKAWGTALAKEKVFPLKATLLENGGRERMRFEVTEITARKITKEEAQLFGPPEGYNQVEPLPF